MGVVSWVFADRMRPFAKVPGPAPSFPLDNGGDFIGVELAVFILVVFREVACVSARRAHGLG